MFTSIAAYHFVAIADPGVVADRLRARAIADGLLGTVLVAGEGINLFLAGEGHAVDAFLGALCEDPRFASLQVKRSASDVAPFARLKVKVKPEIISFRREDASPLQRRAPSVTPETLSRWLDSGCDDDGRRVVLLDTRNREEVGHGSFSGALALPIDNFTDLPEAFDVHREALADATVVGFCTGGIRCEKAVPWMRANGFAHALQLEGGILGYFEQRGGRHYLGNCFVFDDRIALDPALQPVGEGAARRQGDGAGAGAAA